MYLTLVYKAWENRLYGDITTRKAGVWFVFF